MIPTTWLIKGGAALALVALIGFTGWRLHAAGAAAERARVELAETKLELHSAEERLKDYEARVEAVTALAERHRKAAGRVTTITKEVLREVPVLVPADACPLPPGFRVLHDQAARGQAGDPAAASRADGAPVPAQDAAATVVENYGAYHELAERLRGLQQYVREQLNGPPQARP